MSRTLLLPRGQDEVEVASTLAMSATEMNAAEPTVSRLLSRLTIDQFFPIVLVLGELRTFAQEQRWLSFSATIGTGDSTD